MRTSRPGAWKRPQRKALGCALAQVPSRQSSWNQRTRSAAIMTLAIHVRFASRSENGKVKRPESLRRSMCCSTCAWARIVKSSWTGSPS